MSSRSALSNDEAQLIASIAMLAMNCSLALSRTGNLPKNLAEDCAREMRLAADAIQGIAMAKLGDDAPPATRAQELRFAAQELRDRIAP